MTDADQAKQKKPATSKPHDALVQHTFSRPEVAKGYLQSILPPVLVQHFDLDQIERDVRSSVDPDLSERLSDLTFRVKLRPDGESPDREALVYVLIEHQSRSDPVMAARLYVYTGRALNRWLRDNKGAKTVPAVLPLVLYNGRRPWTAATSLSDLFALSEHMRTAAEGFLPELHYQVDDLRRTTDEALRSRPVVPIGRLTLLFLRHGSDTEKELLAFLHQEELLADLENRDDLIAHANYILSVDSSETKQEVFEALKHALGPKNREVAVTVAEQLRQEGRQEGLQELLLILLRHKFKVDAEAEIRVATADDETLRTWAIRVVTAKTLEEVFSSAE